MSPRDPSGRVPPHDLSAEQAVISAVLIKPDLIDDLAPILRGEHFYGDAHGRIYDACIAVAASGSPVDIATVASWLHDRGTLRAVGGIEYLGHVVDATPAVRHVEAHARIVTRKARIRRIIAEAQCIAAEGYGDIGDDDAWAESAEQRLASVAETSTSRSIIEIGDALRSYYEQLKLEAEGRAEPVGGRFGVGALDAVLWPLEPRRVTVIGGFPGDGKTALGLQAAEATASMRQNGRPCASLVISCEMGAQELAKRALFRRGAVDSSKARPNRLGEITPEEWGMLTAAGSFLGKLPVYIDDRDDASIDDLAPSVRRHKARAKRDGYDLRLVVVDYLQLIGGPHAMVAKKSSVREQEVSAVARGLKRLAKMCDVHVMALAQLNDDQSKRSAENKRPTSRDFRESKAIWANADNCVLIHNEGVRARAAAKVRGERIQAPDAEDVELIIDKNRDGRTCTVDAQFVPHLTLFRDRSGGEWA